MSQAPQWYMAVGGQQVGPVSEEDIVNNIKNGSVDAQTLVFIAGMDAWTPIKDVPKFAPHLRDIHGPAFVDKTGIPRDHEKLFEFRKRGGDVFGHAINKILLIGIP